MGASPMRGVTTEKFEYVVMNSRDELTSRSSGRPRVIGETEAGRMICRVYEVEDDICCYLITAFDVD